jgi:uncharacterized protein involved in exopolysaccharide biosynthesis
MDLDKSSGKNENSEVSFSRDDGGLELIEIFLRLWKYKFIGISIIFFFLFCGILFLHMANYQYRAELVVVPADQSGGNPSSTGISGLGSLVGIDLSLQQGASFARYPDAVRSFTVAEVLSQNPKIMRAVFSDQFNPQTGKWTEPESLRKSLTNSIKPLLGIPVRAWSRPNAKNLKMYIESNVKISEDKKKSSVTLSYENFDPDFARYFINEINFTSDEYLRKLALDRSESYIKYLEKRLNEVNALEYRISLSETLSSYEKTKMMASSSVPFSAEPFGNIWISPKPSSPQPVFILFISLVAGGVFWIGVVFFALPFIARLRSGLID